MLTISIAVLIVYFARIVRLEEKKFHMLMLILLLASVVLAFLFTLALYKWVQKYQLNPEIFDSGLLTAAGILLASAWCLNEVAHFLFIMKIWVLSHKIQAIAQAESLLDAKFQVKVSVLYYGMLGFILVACVLNCIYNLKEWYIYSKYYRLWQFFFSLPSWILVTILANAFMRLKKHSQNLQY
jgi:hypothetical protein